MELLHINYDGLPSAERALFRDHLDLFFRLEGYANNFRYAVDLLEFSESCAARSIKQAVTSGDFERSREDDGRFQTWQFCAAEWAAIQLYHFGKVLEMILAVRGNQNLRTVTSYMDKAALRTPAALFAASFPDHDDIRHAAAHQAEFNKNSAKHAVSGGIDEKGLKVKPGTSAMISSQLSGRTYMTTVDGKLLKFDMSHRNTEALLDVTDKAVAAFAPVIAALAAVPAGETLKPKGRP